MKVIQGFNELTPDDNSIVTVGSFDGIHLGHQRIVQQMRKLEGTITVLTFDPHPQMILRPNQAPPLLTTFEEKLRLFEKLSVDKLIIIKFDKEFASLSPSEFIEEIIVKKVGLAHIFVGPNHAFGQGRKGDVKLIHELGEKHGFEVHVVDPVNRFNEKISSTRIRKLLLKGDPLTAWRCLGRPFYMDAEVIEGDNRGKKLGFPTANLRLTDTEKLIPPSAVYVTVTEVDGIRWPSVSHFGPRPTFRGASPAFETFIIGFRKDIYGKDVRVGFIDVLRDIKTFRTPAELVQQLRMDIRNSAQRLAELGFGSNARLRIQRFGKVLL